MSAKDALRRYRNGSLLGFLILFVGLFAVRVEDMQRGDRANAAIVQSTIVTGVANCNQDFRGRVEVLSVLEGSRDFARLQFENGEISRKTFEVGDSFYAERIKGLALPDCRKIEQTITANADRLDKIIEEPLYPGSPQTRGTDNSGEGGQDPGPRPSPGGGGG